MDSYKRRVKYDPELNIEAYAFKGMEKPFPNHFHEHYVIGIVEQGERYLFCKNKRYVIEKGNVILFNPMDNHCCKQRGVDSFYFKGFNIGSEVIIDLLGEFIGSEPLRFRDNIVYDSNIYRLLADLFNLIFNGGNKGEKRRALKAVLFSLMADFGVKQEEDNGSLVIKKADRYIEEHFDEKIGLKELCEAAGVSKSALLRHFTKEKGITPYRYLEMVRINRAKRLLTQGYTPVEAALKTGFSDQSHFSNYFTAFIGFTPGMYRELYMNREIVKL